MSNTDKKVTSAPTPAAGAAVSAPASTKPPVTSGTSVSAGTVVPEPLSTPIAVATASAAEGNETDKIQYFIIEGKVDTFPDVSKAEKFLNSPEAPVCTVVYGKVSLVNEWHITTGKIHTFKTLVKAQKFLKEPTAPKEFVMVRGRITVPEIRVSLRG